MLQRDVEDKDAKLLNYASNLQIAGGAAGKSQYNDLKGTMERLQKLTKDYNDLNTRMENVLLENRFLRQIKDVPANFGEDFESYKNQEKNNALYYKQKNEYYEKQIRALEEERADLHARLRRTAGLAAKVDGVDEMGLDQDQIQHLREYALNLRSGSKELPLTDKSRELHEEVIRLKAMLATYENIQMQPANQQFISATGGPERYETGSAPAANPAGLNEDQMNTLLGAIQTQKREIEHLFASAKPGAIPAEDHKVVTHNNTKSKIGIEVVNNSNRPPKPFPGVFGDWTEVSEGMSYKFGSKLQLKSYDEELAGMDLDKAKYFIAVLQLHNMESMELLAQRDQENRTVAAEVEDAKASLKQALAVQDELFVRHLNEMTNLESTTKDLRKQVDELQKEKNDFKARAELFESSLKAVGTRSGNTAESRIADLTMNLAISETNIIKLSRKYDALEQEYEAQARAWKIVDVDQNEREHQMVQKMTKLLEWKADASQKLKIVLERLKQSVSVEEHSQLKAEFELERNKYVNLKANENTLTSQVSHLRGLERELAVRTDDVKQLQDEITAMDVEFGVLHMRLCAMDPIYNRHMLIFKKVADVLKGNNISPLQYFQAIDLDKNGFLSAQEFIRALESMSVQVTRDEGEEFFSFMDLDGSGLIDYVEFSRKLRRMGVAIRSKEEELVNKMWAAITRSGMTLEEAFKAFDRDAKGSISFNEMMQTMKDIHVEIDAKSASEFFKFVDVSDNGQVSEAEFIHVFKRFNKIHSANSLSPESTLDWKLEMMSRLDKVATDKGLTIEEIFNDIDSDKDGKITETELRRMFLKMEVRFNKKEFSNLFFSIDTNRSGVVTYTEFLNYVNMAKKESERLSRMKLLSKKFSAANLLGECRLFTNISSSDR
jgi:Ca2+-binding EF-hand superfamily protein